MLACDWFLEPAHQSGEEQQATDALKLACQTKGETRVGASNLCLCTWLVQVVILTFGCSCCAVIAGLS